MVIKVRTLQDIISWVSLVLGLIFLFLEFALNAHSVGLIILTIGLCVSGSIGTFLQRHTGDRIGSKESK